MLVDPGVQGNVATVETFQRIFFAEGVRMPYTGSFFVLALLGSLLYSHIGFSARRCWVASGMGRSSRAKKASNSPADSLVVVAWSMSRCAQSNR